jgi:Zn-dependent peptidase ImmA (M78 family)/DNA-binding XRE family transcriptional regulator
MPPPTPGFVGERLREARQVRGLRAVQLAEILGVTPSAISAYETGRKSPTPPVADAIAAKLNLPLYYFLRPVIDRPVDPVFYRSMSAATKTARSRAEGRLRWLEDLADHLGAVVAFPDINLPAVDLPSNPLVLSDEDIEQIAADARAHWQMSADGPISHMVYLLENQGVIVARDYLGASTLESLSSVSGVSGRPYVMIGTDKGTAVRWRFDAAHELGHLILHQGINPKLISNAGDHKRIEDQAHRFAAAFLLPMAAFADDFFSASLDVLRAMKPKWRVSIAMMIKRAHDGALISDGHYSQLYRNYSRRRWNGSEPLDDTLEAEEPNLMRKAVELSLTEGAQSGSDLAASVALSANDIENLCSLAPGYLAASDEPAVSIRSDHDRSNVFQFPGRR